MIRENLDIGRPDPVTLKPIADNSGASRPATGSLPWRDSADGPKSPREQQLKPAVVAQEVQVVKRLLVVRIGASSTRLWTRGLPSFRAEARRARAPACVPAPQPDLLPPTPIAPVMAVYGTWYMRTCVLATIDLDVVRRHRLRHSFISVVGNLPPHRLPAPPDVRAAWPRLERPHQRRRQHV